ncbi:hypothetical protein [Methylobacterium nigriterrae]|uniref:hypothetical protein n=1 Tax=Methylobacterium nigriterrae TaxID=3127512 RepID=UPI0030135EF2
MPSSATPDILPQGEITFRGRGLAVMQGRRLSLKVCPRCSQRNDRRAAEQGHCHWCAYIPSLADAEPISPGSA